MGERQERERVRGQAVDGWRSGSLDQYEGVCICGYVCGLAGWCEEIAGSILGQRERVRDQAGEWRQSRRSRACVLLVAGASMRAHMRLLFVGRGDHRIPPLRVLDDCLSKASWELRAGQDGQDRPIARVGTVVRIGRTDAPSFVPWCREGKLKFV